MQRDLFFVRLFVLCGLVAVSAFSQTAQLTGTVADQSGSVVPGAKVTATNINTGVSRATVANIHSMPWLTILSRPETWLRASDSSSAKASADPVT